MVMARFEEMCNEIIMLSDILYRQKLRTCFIEHFSERLKAFQQCCTKECLNVNILQKLQFKLLEPIMLHLRKSEKSNEKCLLIQCLIDILALTEVAESNVFFHLYLLIFSQIFRKNNMEHKASEELQMLVLEAGSYLIKKCSPDILNEIYDQGSGGKFSIGIFQALQIAKEERSIKLRTEALTFLLIASQFQVNAAYNEGIYKRLGDLYMLYLPGTIASLQEIIFRNEAQHHIITTEAIKCWGHILCLVLCDIVTNHQPTENEILNKWNDAVNNSSTTADKNNVDKALSERCRSSNWQTAAAATLKPLIFRMSDMRKHSNKKCRLELTKVMVKLFENCALNLKPALGPILDVIVSSAVDQDEDISQTAQNSLKNIKTLCEQKKLQTFIFVMETNFYLVLNKLPGVIHSGNENLLLSSLKSLLGYLRILAEANKLRPLIGLLHTLKKLIYIIQLSFQVEIDPGVCDQNSPHWSDVTHSNTWSKPWKRFRHFTDDSIRCELEKICQLLGECGEPETVFDYLLEIYATATAYKIEILLIINQIILGTKKMEDHLVNQLLDFYLDPENFYLPLEANGPNGLTMKELQSNVIEVACIIEGIGNIARKLGNGFQRHLFRTLYYVIEKMGSSHPLIRTEASKSAVEISLACGLEGSLESLIKSNVDYLTYHLVTKLRRRHSSVYDVVIVMMKNSAIQTMANVEEIINDVLETSSQNLDSPFTISYLRLFETFVFCVKNWLTGSGKSSVKPRDLKEEVAVSFLNYVKSKEIEKTAENSLGQQEGSAEECETVREDEKADLPRHIRMTVTVSGHCLNFLASKDRDKKLIVLEILRECVLILSEWENELLPLVHKIWGPLVTRFDEITDPLIIRNCFLLLTALAQTSRHFIRSRALKNVIPKLHDFLIKECRRSKLKNSSSYYLTQNFKLQRDLLEKLGNLTVNLELFEKETDLIIESILPYLSVFQPKELQDKSLLTFFSLKAYDPYLVWLKLRHLSQNPEFCKNVQIILKSAL